MTILDLTSPEKECLNCGTINHVTADSINIDEDGPYTACSTCEGSFDIPEELYNLLKSNEANEVK